MRPLLYRELVPWYRLLDPAKDHADEAAAYQAALERACSPRAETLLELGSGAGHNALYLKRRFRCTLADLSEDMLGLSRQLNPECEHHQGDMRTLRLGKTFDTVLIHDAIMYMTNLEDLRAAVRTAFVHTRPGGSALFAPDYVRDTFHEDSDLHAEQEADGSRALRCLAWSWDPDPQDDTFITEYAFLLRDGTTVTAVHDRHMEGLFSKATWLDVLTGAGFQEVELVKRPLGDEEGATDEVFLCRRP
jgi:SAM-dependent methyltransferase